MERRHGARGKTRSARNIALMDQLVTELQNAETYLASYEVSRRLPRVHHADLFLALERLYREGRIEKIKRPLLKHVFWGIAGRNYGPFFGFARLTEQVERLREALEAAPPPIGDSWVEEYESWWSRRRSDAL